MKRFKVTFEVNSENDWQAYHNGKQYLNGSSAWAVFPDYVVPADAVIEVIGREVLDGYYCADAGTGGFAHYLYHRHGGVWSWLVAGKWSAMAGDGADPWCGGRDWPIDDDAVRGGALVLIEG